MSIELKIPDVGESITQVQISRWLKQPGDTVTRDEPIVEIETDKVTTELPAPEAGQLGEILTKAGEEAEVGQTIGYIETDGDAATAAGEGQTGQQVAEGEADTDEEVHSDRTTEAESTESQQAGAGEQGEAASPAATAGPLGGETHPESEDEDSDTADKAAASTAEAPSLPPPVKPAAAPKPTGAVQGIPADDPDVEVVPMSPMRRRIAERLVQAQQTAAMLTTFNEIDMSEVMALRKQYQEPFQQRYGIKLGFMSFFVKASIEALKEFPGVNAQIHDQSIVYFHRYDIGVAIGGGKGLVVPVIRHAEQLSMAEIEKTIADFAERAGKNTLELKELQGGTFTISNGGVYGSLLSTPILNPPQSGILGLHTIQERPVARDGQVVIRPMMYVALSYDHRIVDGREAVTFLRRLKEIIESPLRMLIEV